MMNMSLQNSYFIFLICSSVTWLHIDMKSISSPKELSEMKEMLLLFYYGAARAGGGSAACAGSR